CLRIFRPIVCSRCPAPDALYLLHREQTIGLKIRKQLLAPVWPDHLQRVDPSRLSQTKMLPVVHGGPVPARRTVVEVLRLATLREDELRTAAAGVRRLTVELHLQPVM